MRILLLAAMVYLAAVLETALVDAMRIGPVTPDLLALLAVVWLVSTRSPRAFLLAAAAALAGDLIAPGRLGVGTFWMLLIGYAITQLKMRLRHDYLLLQVFLVFVAVTLWAAAVGLTGRLLGDVLCSTPTVLARAVGVGLYTAVVGLPLLMVLGWLRSSQRKEEWNLAPR